MTVIRTNESRNRKRRRRHAAQSFSANDLVIVLLFTCTLLYISAPLFRAAANPYRTAPVEGHVREDIWELYGIIIREEAVIPAEGVAAVPTVSSGQAVAAGTQIALCNERSVFSPAAGIYIRETDGFEQLSPTQLTELTPNDVDRLMSLTPNQSPSLGKIVTDQAWLFVTTAETALTETLHEGSVAAFTVHKEQPFTLTATVVRISPPIDGRCAIVFRCVEHLQNTQHLRYLTVSFPRTRIEGLRIPSSAVYSDEAGSFVYQYTAAQANKISVNILSEENGYTIISKDSHAAALQAGDMIMISTSRPKEDVPVK